MQQIFKQSALFIFILGLIATPYLLYQHLHFPAKYFVVETIAYGIICLKLIQGGNFFQKNILHFKDVLYNFIIVSCMVVFTSIIMQYGITKYVEQQAYIDWFQNTFILKTIIWIVFANLLSIIYYITLDKTIKLDENRIQSIVTNNKQEAELTKLRQQINPHFLFNALNSINALMQFDIEKARTMIINVSKYYRNTINAHDDKWQSLAKEIEDIQLYFAIEKIRFGHRLDLTIDADNTLLNHAVPPLLFQPLVENAIKYGLYGTLGNVSIQVKIYKTYSSTQKEFITFEINNPFDTSTDQKPAGTGFGLNNIKQRLYVLYGNNLLFKTTIKVINEQTAKFTAYLSLPQSNQNENKNPVN